jgi:hypothetical protein
MDTAGLSKPSLERMHQVCKHTSSVKKWPASSRSTAITGSSARACVLCCCRPPTRPFHRRPVLRPHSAKPVLNEPANAGDASRATIWQGNCHGEDQLFYSDITPAQNTIPIQYPISNCPAKPTGSFKRLYRKRAKAPCSRTFLRRCASDKALTFFVPNPA